MLHGGEIYNSTQVRHDFSVNINPLGIPETVFWRLRESLPFLTQYPDQDCRELRLALEKYTGIPARQILCGNGASELIEAAVRGLRIQSILLTAPSFSGYQHAAQSHGCRILCHALQREEDFALTERYLGDLAKRPEMAILCSPSNPIGDRIDPDLLLRIAETCEEQGTWLLVDECFLGFMKDEEERTMRRLLVTQEIPSKFCEPPGARGAAAVGKIQDKKERIPGLPNAAGSGGGPFRHLLVLDAFTKRFAMPGIRLGYLMAADPEILGKIHAQQPEWSVSLPAQIAGLAALQSGAEYMETARALIASERKRMTAALENFGCKVFPGEANYIFFSTDKEICEPLLQRGILIRNCDNYRGLQKGDYRVAVLKPEENTIFLETLAQIMT